jgi:NCAIR mutase (PurE)-related protein
VDEKRLHDLLAAVRDGETSIEAASAALSLPRITDLGFARVDQERELRCGFPEVVLCEGKRPDHAARIAIELFTRSERVLLTRAGGEVFARLTAALDHEPALLHGASVVHHEEARAIALRRGSALEGKPHGLVAVLSAGTADLPVAAEARVTAETMGARVEARFDVGVAALHRLLAEGELLRAARVVVVVAGMEGALASVVGGLVARPVIAVPSSVGYGASFGGLAALLTMLNSCAPNVATVNIDNGFAAGYLAALINAG